MKAGDLTTALSTKLPATLASEVVKQFFALRQDSSTGTLGGAAPGKFVETLVQVLQFLDAGTFEPKPDVDGFLRGLESRPTSLDEGLRICASRVARAMYTLRNKRNIAHLGAVDPNQYDLRFLAHSAQWIMAELLRSVMGSKMEEAGKLMEFVQIPLNPIVEDFGSHRLVLPNASIPDETLLLLRTAHPNELGVPELERSMSRRSKGGIRNAIRELWRDKLIEGDSTRGYRLTRNGFSRATEIAKTLS